MLFRETIFIRSGIIPSVHKSKTGYYFVISTNRYDHILIDEFQDISNQRLELIKCFVNEKTNTKLFCVGDDWQSIYKFSGSELSFFVDFERFFEQPAVTNLKINYRSIKSIVDVSTKLINNNANQRLKEINARDKKERKIVYVKIPVLLVTVNIIRSRIII